MKKDKTKTIELIKEKEDYDCFGHNGRSREEIFNDQSKPVDERIFVCVEAALEKLTLVRAVLNADDTTKLTGYPLFATTDTVNDAFKHLKAAADLYFKNH